MRSASSRVVREPSAPSAAAAEPSAATLVVRLESVVDYDETAALAAEAFASGSNRFAAGEMRWLYEHAFSDGTTVLAAHADGRKVGHLALVHQRVALGGRVEPAIALIDVFLTEAYRSFPAIVGLYRAVEALCRERGIRFIVSVPNEMAAPVNARVLRLATAAELDIRVGFGGLPVPGCRVASHAVADLDPACGRALVAPYCGDAQAGLAWSPKRLWARLGRPGAGYALHAAERLLLISAPRSERRVPHVLICALLPRPGAVVRRRDVAAVTAAACRWHRRPVFVYAGINDALPLPGMLLPKRLRPSPMILQMRDFRPDAKPVAFARFEPLDFDFA